MMQLMPGTAREQAGKMGVGYDSGRLTTDPNYNVMLGSAYFRRMLNRWDGNVPLAVASYNAGSGNVRKWVRTYGDPRGQVDMVKWIEAIPFTETKAYVQRVIENSVVYDSMRGGAAAADRRCTSRAISGKTARADMRRPWPTAPRFITPEGFARIRAEYEELFGDRAAEAGRDDRLGRRQRRPVGEWRLHLRPQAAARDRPAARRISRAS